MIGVGKSIRQIWVNNKGRDAVGFERRTKIKHTHTHEKNTKKKNMNSVV